MRKDNYKETTLRIWNNLPPALYSDDTIRLIKEYKLYGDKKVRDEVVYGNMRLVAYWINKKAKHLVNRDCQAYPSVEDLQQIGAMICAEAIEKFNPEYNFTFATYLFSALRKIYRIDTDANRQKRQAKVVSLDKSVDKDDDEGTPLQYYISDDKFTEDSMSDKLEVEFILKEILPLFPKRDREIFYDVYVNQMSFDDAGKKQGISRQMVDMILGDMRARIEAMYMDGITDLDRELRGVNLGKKSSRYALAHSIIKKYGKDFLEQQFLPILTPNQRLIFEKGVLYYYGQSDQELKREIGTGNLSNRIKDIIKKLEKEAPKLQKMRERGETPKPRKLPLKTQQKINKNKNLIEQYGGRLFLAKYFMRTLSEEEKRVFVVAVLNFNGESVTQMSKQVGKSVANFSIYYSKIIEKLEKTDFDTLVTLVDNAEKDNIDIQTINMQKMDKLKQRRDIVEKFGGVLRLRELFLPILPDVQRRVFEDMYLYPKYDSLDAMAKSVGLKTCMPLLVAEKVVLEKLQSTNLDELERIRERANEELEIARITNYRKVVNGNKKLINKCGGEAFLREKFLPTLQVKAHRIVFEKYMLENYSVRSVLEELGLPDKARDYIDKTLFNLRHRLETFRESFEDFDKAVKDFYTQKEFEKIHTEDFEKQALGVVEEKQEEEKQEVDEIKFSKIGSVEFGEKRRAYMDDFLKKYGGKKELVRSFMPTLKKVLYQQVFLGTFLEGKLDAVVASEYNLSAIELRTVKKYIVDELDKYATKNAQKTKRPYNKEK